MSGDRHYVDVYPITIFSDRYGGYHSNGLWLAFPLEPSYVPVAVYGNEPESHRWWELAVHLPIGRGTTPDIACADLVTRLEAMLPDDESEPFDEVGDPSTLCRWRLRWPWGTTTLEAVAERQPQGQTGESPS